MQTERNRDARETALAKAPRLVRLSEEFQWRASAALGAAVAVVGYWVMSWLVGLPVDAAQAGAAFGVAFVPTLALGIPAARRRAAAARESSGRLPPGGIRETRAAARERRGKLAGIVLTGVLALLVFDAVFDGGGPIAGLVAGVLGGVGVADLLEARGWRRAEQARGVRLLALIAHDALTIAPTSDKVFEDRRGALDPVPGPSPFDLDQ